MDEEDEHLKPAVVVRKSLTSFPFSKTTCVCNCGKYNLQDLPRLRKILPEDYEYKLCEYLPLDREDKFLVTLRMTLSSQEEALEWKRRFEEKSLTTHVKDKTFPKVERVSIFKAQYRCQFFDRRKNKKKLPEKSKFRDCHSILFMNIKKYFKNTVDRHMPMYQTVIRLHYAHNHPLDTADVLKKRQLNEDIKCRFLEMFRQGMKPKDALDKHKRELLQNLGPEKYRQVVCDGYYVPNVPKAYRLYYQIHGKGVSAKTTTKRSSRHNPNPDWIAFQNFPGADNDEGCEAARVNDGGSDVSVPDDDEVEESGEVDEEQHDLVADISCCQEIMNQQNSLRAPTSGGSDRDAGVSQYAAHTCSKPVVDDLTIHGTHNGHLQKLSNTNVTYTDNNSAAYTDIRDQNMPSQSIPVSTFGDTHLGMGFFNLAQPSWENFNMTHQQATVANLQPQPGLGFQNLDHQHQSGNYMILPNTSCQNAGNHFVPSQGMLTHSSGLQNTLSRTDLNIVGPNSGQQYSWAQVQPNYNLNMSEVCLDIQDPRRNQTQQPKHLSNQSQGIQSISAKKTTRKRKKKSFRELNMKHVTKRWMDKKPKVEAETQNMASEVLQNILLTDEAGKLKDRLLTFLSDLESKMAASPKIFVPAIRQFLHAGEGAEDDFKLASYLKDFGKTEENVLKNLEDKKIESRVSHYTQTKLSGPVFKLGNVKPNRVNAKLNRPINTTGINQKSYSVARVRNSTSGCRIKRKQKLKAVTDTLLLTVDVVQPSDFSLAPGPGHSDLKSECDVNDKNMSDSTMKPKRAKRQPSNCCKQLKKRAMRTVRKIKERPNISTLANKQRGKHKTEQEVVLTEEELFSPNTFSQTHKVPSDASRTSASLTKKLVVKFTRIKRAMQSGPHD